MVRGAYSSCVVDAEMGFGPTGFFEELETSGWRLPEHDYSNLSCQMSPGQGLGDMPRWDDICAELVLF